MRIFVFRETGHVGGAARGEGERHDPGTQLTLAAIKAASSAWLALKLPGRASEFQRWQPRFGLQLIVTDVWEFHFPDPSPTGSDAAQ